MKTKNVYVPLWLTYGTYFASYSDEQVGRIARAMMAYRDTGTEPDFAGSEKYIWPAIQRDIDNLVRTMEERSQRNSINGAKGGRPRKVPDGGESGQIPEGSERIPTEPEKGNEMVNVNERESERVNENEGETVNGNADAKGSEAVKEKKNESAPKTTTTTTDASPTAQKPQARVVGGTNAREEKILLRLGDHFEKNCRQNRTEMLTNAFRESLRDGASEALLREMVNVTAASLPEKPVLYLCGVLENLRKEGVRDVKGYKARQAAHQKRKAPAAGLKRDQMFDYSGEEGSL